MCRATADTNVLVSALLYRTGKPYELLRMATAGEITLRVSEPIIDETLDVLVRKFCIAQVDLPEYLAVINNAAETVLPALRLEIVREDQGDNKIVECVVTAASDYVVRGDKHLLRLGVYNGIRILKVSDFLEIEKAQGREQ